MQDTTKLENNIKAMIDRLKGLCSTNGLSNSASEEEVITTVFLYKFLNDKFIYNLRNYAIERNKTPREIVRSESDLKAFYSAKSQDVCIPVKDTIQALAPYVNKSNFSTLFDNALQDISNDERNQDFSVKTASGAREPLFIRITEEVESSKRNNFAQNIFGIITKDEFDFTDAFNSSFDFYSAIFEYLIHDYNVASGTYAEYFTPQSVSSIIAKILVEMSPATANTYEVYDPCAGSGSLVLHLANALGEGPAGKRAQVYTQDISAKSTRFLRLNLILNGMTGSLEHVVEGDTLESPAHYKVDGQPASGIKQFDYITSNPPFKRDFSSSRNAIENNWKDSEERDGIKRFFAGVPIEPDSKKEKMPIYLCFVQHILWSLKPNGKAAIVVPTGFLTDSHNIEKTIRQKIINKCWLKGVISMPSNIFANTGTNVSILFIDKSNIGGNIILIDASNLGEKQKDGNNQRTILRQNETYLIDDVFINQKVVEDFSVLVTYDEIKDKNYSFKAGQFFDVKLDHIELTEKEFNDKIKKSSSKLSILFENEKSLEMDIQNRLDKFKYGNND